MDEDDLDRANAEAHLLSINEAVLRWIRKIRENCLETTRMTHLRAVGYKDTTTDELIHLAFCRVCSAYPILPGHPTLGELGNLILYSHSDPAIKQHFTTPADCPCPGLFLKLQNFKPND